MDVPPDNYDVVPYEERYRNDVLRLRSVFRSVSDAWNAEHFRWQQEENPWFDGHQIRLALHRGAVVGMRVLQAAEWDVGTPSIRFRAPCYAGTVIEDGHRSRGLISRLTRAVEQDAQLSGARFAFNLNAGPVTHISALREGWRALGPFDPVERPQRNDGVGLGRRACFASLSPRWGAFREGV